MEIEKFNEIIEEIQKYFSKEYNEIQKQEIFKYFSKYSEKRFVYIVSKIYQNNKFLPILADLIAIDKEIPYRAIEKNEIKKTDNKICPICQNNGFVLYKKRANGLEYEHIAYCECPAGLNYMYDGTKMKDPRNRSNYIVPSYKEIMHLS